MGVRSNPNWGEGGPSSENLEMYSISSTPPWKPSLSYATWPSLEKIDLNWSGEGGGRSEHWEIYFISLKHFYVLKTPSIVSIQQTGSFIMNITQRNSDIVTLLEML